MPSFPPPPPLPALILEGGAMRAIFTCGVLDTLWGHVQVSSIFGTSAGALFGCNWKSGQPGRALRYNKKYARSWRFCSLLNLLFTGNLYGTRFCYHTIPFKLDPFDVPAFQTSPIRFFITATDILSGQPIVHECPNGDETDLRWMRASASMPIVSRPVPIDGHLYLDGGITDPIPLRTAETLGYPRAIVILTQPASYRKTSGPEVTWTRRLLGRRYPALADAMERRADLYNAQTAYVAERQALRSAFVIRPPEPLRISRTASSPAALQRVYDLGTSVALAILSPLLRWLAEPPPPPPAPS